MVRPLEAVYSARQPVQEADRRGLAQRLLLFPAAPDLTHGPAGGPGKGGSQVAPPFIFGNLGSITKLLDMVPASQALLRGVTLQLRLGVTQPPGQEEGLGLVCSDTRPLL